MTDRPVPGPRPGPRPSIAAAAPAQVHRGEGGLPRTGHAAVDAILAEVADDAELTPAERLEQLTLAHEALHRVLTDSEQAPLPRPGQA